MTDDDKIVDSAGNVDEEELDRRITEMGLDQASPIDQAKEKAAKIDEEFEGKLRNLEARADKAKSLRQNQTREVNRKLASDREAARGLGIGISIAYTIIGLPLFGAGVGWLVDSRLGVDFWKGIGVLIGAILGIGMAFYMINRRNNP